MSDFLLYGANGYTGRLIAAHAVEQGLRPLLAGRNAAEIAAIAAEHGLDSRVFALDDAAALESALREVPVVLHAAGPFSRTAEQMAHACLRTRTHYLDITGEIGVFEALAARGEEASAAGVMLLPGAGFDVVPTDCLAAHLKRRLPTASTLSLAFQGLGGVSRGTAVTAVENIERGGAVRIGGTVTPVPAAWKSREIDFGRGPVTATTIPWGDVSTAFFSTGIRNIEVCTVVPTAARRAMVASRYLGWLLGAPQVKSLLKRQIRSRKPGPTEEERARGESRVWGEVEDDRGGRAVSRLFTPEGYTLTAMTSVAAVARVRAGGARAGFQTPSRVFGADWILEFPGVRREDLD